MISHYRTTGLRQNFRSISLGSWMVDDVDVMKFQSASSSLAIGLGANMPFGHDRPVDTLERVKPLLMDRLAVWAAAAEIDSCWSTSIKTAPVGGAQVQPDYWNAVVLVSHIDRPYSLMAALELLDHLRVWKLSSAAIVRLSNVGGRAHSILIFCFGVSFAASIRPCLAASKDAPAALVLLQPLLEIMRA